MHVHSPLTILLLLTGGDLLIIWEVNRPGMILPGATGLLLVLLAAAGVLENGGSWLHVLPLGLAVGCFVLDTRRPRWWLTAVTCALLLWFLLEAVRPAHSPMAMMATAGTALLLALVHGWMARIARRARLNKGLD